MENKEREHDMKTINWVILEYNYLIRKISKEVIKTMKKEKEKNNGV